MRPRNSTLCALLGAGLIVMLGGCHDNTQTTPASPPPGPLSVGFESFVQMQTEKDTCESAPTFDINGENFVFNTDQDVAVPRDVSAVIPGCSGTTG